MEEEDEDKSMMEEEDEEEAEEEDVISKIQHLLEQLKKPVKEPIDDTAPKKPPVLKKPASNPVKPPVNSEDEDLLEKYGYLVMENEELKNKVAELQAYKTQMEEEEKLKMMEKFSMLDRTFLSNLKKKLSKYSVEQLEAKLSVEAVRSGVTIKADKGVSTYSLESEDTNLPSWISALEKSKH